MSSRRMNRMNHLGDILLFDGRVVHRGTPCSNERSRAAAYLVYHKKWHTDNWKATPPQRKKIHPCIETPNSRNSGLTLGLVWMRTL